MYEALIENRKFQEIAKRHRVSIGTVSVLVSKAKRKPNFMSEVFHKRDLKDEKFEAVKAVLDDMVLKNEFIDSCEYVMKRVNENTEYTV